jgi:peptide/nickel transport system substrate-binding protein
VKLLALLLAVSAFACGPHRQPTRAGDDVPVTISTEQQSAWIRNFNPMLPPGRSRWPTRSGVYEPLLIYNTFGQGWTPWLATGYKWSEDLSKLSFGIRQGVRWSDGEYLTAADVVFTFELMKRFPALDLRGVWKHCVGVRAVDEHTVEFSFAKAFAPALEDIAHQPIIPEHVFAKVPDPVSFANPTPVGTGPFTEVRVFRPQVYELGRNPYYWQKGRPEAPALRFLAYPSNDQANLALVEGEVDWAGNFVPAVERTFVARAPEHHNTWSPLVGNEVLLWTNNLKKPLDDVRVRKALSMAIDRERLVQIAMFGSTRPAVATGLHDGYGQWRDEEAGKAAWMNLDREGAERLLDEAGCPRGKGGIRSCNGVRMEYDVEVVAGWSDWVRAAQLIARDLETIGVKAQLRVYEFGAWMSRLQEGTFALSVGYSMDGPTPYYFYSTTMSSAMKKPLGTLSPHNWHRYADDTADALLAEFERSASPEAQREVAVKLQKHFAAVVPSIPLFPNPMWGEFSTRRFEGFPSSEHPFARLSPHAEPDALFVLTAIMPRKR